jgi:hypothetical protein
LPVLGINRWLAPEAAVRAGLIPARKRGAGDICATGQLARAQLFRTPSPNSDLASQPRLHHRGVRPARLSDRHPHALRLGVTQLAPAAGHCWPALRRYWDHLAGRNDTRAPQARPLWHLLVMLGCTIVAPLLLYGAYAGFRITNAQLRDFRET